MVARTRSSPLPRLRALLAPRDQLAPTQARAVPPASQLLLGARAAFGNAPIGMAVLGLDGRCLEVNAELARILGRDRSVLHQRDLATASHPVDAEREIAWRNAALAGGPETRRGEHRYLHPDGRVITVLATLTLLRARDDRPHGFVLQVLDLSRQRALEEALAEAQLRTGAMLDGLPVPVALLARDGTITAVNDAWRRVTVAGAGDLVSSGTGVNYLSVCDAAAHDGCEDAGRAAAAIRDVLIGTASAGDLIYEARVGTDERWYRLRVTPLPAGEGAVVTHVDLVAWMTAHPALAARLEHTLVLPAT